MNLTSISSSDFRQIIKLIEKKEALQTRIDKVDRQLASFGSGEGTATLTAGAARPAKAGRRVKRGKRGAMKAAVMEILRGAGKGGMKVKDIAERLGVKYANVSVWFYATGKKLKQIKKAGPGKYVWEG